MLEIWVSAIGISVPVDVDAMSHLYKERPGKIQLFQRMLSKSCTEEDKNRIREEEILPGTKTGHYLYLGNPSNNCAYLQWIAHAKSVNIKYVTSGPSMCLPREGTGQVALALDKLQKQFKDN